MDGINTSTVSSAKETYRCGWETGCEPPDWKPGVWGSGEDRNLWRFPVPLVDFDAISLDLDSLRQEAQNNGLYLAPSEAAGYHLIFLNNATVQVSLVNTSDYIRGYSVPGQGLGGQGQGGCRRRYQIITNE